MAEFRETLLGQCLSDESVKCEVAYKELGFKTKTQANGRPLQADIVFGKKGVSGKIRRPLALIEVKCGATLDRKAIKDLAKLTLPTTGKQKRLRKFFVPISEAKYPKDGLTDKGAADRSFSIEGFPGIRVRRVVRAIGHNAQYEDGLPSSMAAKKKSQHWAVLYEVE